MPSVSKAQAKLMRAVAHSPEFAETVGIPPSVGQDFHRADQAKKQKSQFNLPVSDAKRKRKGF
jgi:hypothetical protein